ncbi:MAG TPA: class I SAM-dependent methyltransferase [Myxococcota bacterium]
MAAGRDEMRALADASLARGDALGWFEELYRRAGPDHARVPWADGVPNPLLVEWLAGPDAAGLRGRALVVGCGYGDDAERLAEAGFAVTAFDVAPTAIEACRARWSGSRVDYVVADALAPPPAWRGAFHFVLESNTLQVLPPGVRAPLLGQLAATLAPGGRLLVLCRGRDPGEPEGQLPWPLTRDELDAVRAHGLEPVRFEDLLDGEAPPVRRFRALYQRPPVG